MTECAVCGKDSDLPRTCRPCRNRIRGLLLGLPELVVQCWMARHPVQRGGESVRVQTSKSAPIPLREDVLNLLGPSAQAVVSGEDQEGPVPVVGVLSAWADLVAEQTRQKPVSHTVSTLTQFLLGHVEWACRREWASDFAKELEGLTKILRRVSGVEPVRILLPVTCPTCDLRTMVREEGSGWAAECRYCSVVKLSAREYAQLVAEQAQAVSTPGEG
ncbi:hypothetical protein KBY91_15340 [Streptomyces sp. RK23]|uniref:hypothetical protein n=1 Tax=unclassified Streptomyces TaxID=2593676 RepID=UPI001B36E842|nr:MULTISPECIES: hypothetical protein [unclassified Streptomyces]MBQ0969202.1 hypothetical protein [Streptomyces sp. RK74B]MBQ1004783.1 hypothetical protein [Streptomyces sp. RK23]